MDSKSSKKAKKASKVKNQKSKSSKTSKKSKGKPKSTKTDNDVIAKKTPQTLEQQIQELQQREKTYLTTIVHGISYN